MAEDIKLWEIIKEKELKEISKAIFKDKYKEQDDLENWLKKEISLISDDLLIIGNQVKTIYGGKIDILCLDKNGDTVIIELKRDMTPRDATAQALDYASWVKDLSYDDITTIYNDYLKKHEEDQMPSLEEAFSGKFNDNLPEMLNQNHKILIVATEMDDSTERIIKYLSETYGVSINFVKFQYLKDDDNKEFIARVFLIEPEEVDEKADKRILSKKRSSFSLEVGNLNVAELEAKLTETLQRRSDLIPRFKKFLEILLSEDRIFNREEIKRKLSKDIGEDEGQTGRYLSNISQFITKRDNSHLRQIINFDSGGYHGAQKDNYQINTQYRELVQSILESIGKI